MDEPLILHSIEDLALLHPGERCLSCPCGNAHLHVGVEYADTWFDLRCLVCHFVLAKSSWWLRDDVNVNLPAICKTSTHPKINPKEIS